MLCTRHLNTRLATLLHSKIIGGYAEKPAKVLFSFVNHIRDESKIDNPLSITALAGSLEAEYKDTIVVAMTHHLLSGGELGIINEIKKQQPDILGLSLGFGSLASAKKILDFVYNNLTSEQQPLVSLGNIMASYNADLFLQMYPKAIVCLGLGEKTMSDLIKYKRGEIELKDVASIKYRDAAGQIVQTPLSNKETGGLAAQNTVFLSDVVESGGVVYLETSRGCPFHCAICDRKNFQGGGWRSKSIENVLKDIVAASKLGVRNVNFVDEDLFAGGVSRVLDLADRIIELKKTGEIAPNFIFGTSCSVRHIYIEGDALEKNENRLQAFIKLRDAGLKVLFIGIESGTTEQLKRYGKAANIKENREAIIRIEQMGIYVVPGFIMFDPQVTLSELKDNIDFLRSTGMDSRITYPLKTYIPLKGSAYTETLIKLGLVDAESYSPDRLAYDYYFQEKTVANILHLLKDWEDSQSMFFWDLKIIFRSANYGRVSIEEQNLLRKYTDEQTKILLDYLADMVNLAESDLDNESAREKLSQKYSRRLILDLLDFIANYEKGKITLGGAEIRKIAYAGLIREVIRVHFKHQSFDALALAGILTQYSAAAEIDFEQIKTILNEFATKQLLKWQKKGYVIGSQFDVYQNIPYVDLPRPAREP
ncbi:radical SAM protein [Candidatus Termititenax persephonae]|uniref:Radical SAM protein n=1 Tax=Candidatus Termititenax persephonae TaxID=2218525 RepID=A0A388TGP7_9BACT|nr:radical SAM protein [Candidatus Termititenax persephonae]